MNNARAIVGLLLIALSLLISVAHSEEAGGAASDQRRSTLEMETLVVSPTRSEEPIGNTAAAIDVVTAEDLERKQVTTVADALRELPGVTVNESGSRGGNISVFLRGADPDQVLVLIDGVRANSTTLGSFDFSGLTPENIERVEVMRGAGGTMYGSDAIGGVIQIFTRKGMGPPRGSIEVSGGNASTDHEVGEVSGESGIFSFSGAASHIHTDGFRPENDDYSNTAVSGSLDTKVVQDGNARVSFRLNDSEFGNFFNNNFLAAPDPNARQKDQNAFTHAEWDQAATKQLRYRLGFSYARENEQFDDPPDAAETTSLHSDLLSETFTGDANATLDWWDGAAESLAGVEYELQSGNVDSTSTDPTFGPFTTKYDRETKNVAGYTLHQLFLDERRLVFTGGVRVDDNDRFGRAVSPSGGASYQLGTTGTRLRANYAQGFKAPTLNQLFFPGFGNPNLDAESSSEVTVGFDQSLIEGRGLASASYFHRKVKDLIVGVPQPDGLLLAENVGDAKTDGAEFAVDAELWSGIHGGGSYTYLNLDASPAGRVRRPRHSGSVHVLAEESGLVQSGDRLTADVRLLLVGDRADFDPTTFAVVDNEGYKRVDLALAYSWPLSGYVQRLKIFARVENVFDERYDEVLGFGSRPTNFLAGVGGEL